MARERELPASYQLSRIVMASKVLWLLHQPIVYFFIINTANRGGCCRSRARRYRKAAFRCNFRLSTDESLIYLICILPSCGSRLLSIDKGAILNSLLLQLLEILSE